MSGEYCASKAGVTGLVRAAATDYAKANIRVNALLPGSTKTPMVEQAFATKPRN
jgi:NAD(P)-dependent dehydrogenase (short-subunit alcohol dehydrogenase family)